MNFSNKFDINLLCGVSGNARKLRTLMDVQTNEQTNEQVDGQAYSYTPRPQLRSEGSFICSLNTTSIMIKMQGRDFHTTISRKAIMSSQTWELLKYLDYTGTNRSIL